MGLLTFEDGIISLDGEVLDGLFQNIGVKTAVRFDEAKVDGSSGTKRTPQGFEDSEITIRLLLVTTEESTCYDKLERINAIFKGLDKNANPKIYSISNSHLLARGVREVVFASLDSTENNTTDEISLTLRFIEHNPPVIKAEEAKAKQPTASELAELAEENTQEEPEFIITVTE